jgi:hypothetical protein
MRRASRAAAARNPSSHPARFLRTRILIFPWIKNYAIKEFMAALNADD